MTVEKIQQSLQNLRRAIAALEKVLQMPLDDDNIVLDSTIQRFEFSIELFGKALKRALTYEEMGEIKTAREAFKRAYQLHWIEEEESWLEMLDDRNKTSHTYNEESARKIYQNIKRNFPVLKKGFDFLEKRYS